MGVSNSSLIGDWGLVYHGCRDVEERAVDAGYSARSCLSRG